MRLPVTASIGLTGHADLYDADGKFVGMFLRLADANLILGLADKGAAVYRQTAAYERDRDRAARDWNPGDAATDVPID